MPSDSAPSRTPSSASAFPPRRWRPIAPGTPARTVAVLHVLRVRDAAVALVVGVGLAFGAVHAWRHFAPAGPVLEVHADPRAASTGPGLEVHAGQPGQPGQLDPSGQPGPSGQPDPRAARAALRLHALERLEGLDARTWADDTTAAERRGLVAPFLERDATDAELDRFAARVTAAARGALERGGSSTTADAVRAALEVER